jgi:GTP pyrophosphokinase
MLRLERILEAVQSYSPDARLDIIRKAWVFGSKYHQGQKRKSGEPFFAHPLEVAHILTELKMDTETIAVAILHDTVEDTVATLDDIKKQFGPSVANLVEGVTKLDKLDFRTAEEAQAENFRKLVFAMAKDIRVIVVKLADRLHNMRTLGAMAPEKRKLIARETMELYAPIANRLGIVSIQGQLQDLSFEHLHPEVHEELSRQIESRRPHFEAYIERVQSELDTALGPHTDGAEVTGRVKRLWSIWIKMQEKELTFEEVHDLLAFRVLVDNVADCYGVLGTVHGLWAPHSDRFKDYIARPKANGYQSLHTVVSGPEGQRVEVQIRTREMHRLAEYGIAAHWKYKEGKLVLSNDEVAQYTKIRQLLEWAEDIEDSREFLDVLKLDLYTDQVHVYTPAGDIRWFPQGATALDFAYAIHTEVGHHCAGARVNGRMVKLGYPLRPADVVEIITRNYKSPTKDWLNYAGTSRALSKIRQHLRKEEKCKATEVGLAILEQELRKHKLSIKALVKKDGLARALEEFHHPNADLLYADVGYGRLLPEKFLALYVDPEDLGEEEEEVGVKSLTDLFRKMGRRSTSPVRIDGVDGMLTHMSKCCRPLPGDPIMGFITRGRGVAIHRSGCSQALALAAERRVDVEWSGEQKGQHSAHLHLVTVDRPMMLAELTQAIGKMNVNISRAEARTNRKERAQILLEVSVSDARQLQNLMGALSKLSGVISVDRAATS